MSGKKANYKLPSFSSKTYGWLQLQYFAHQYVRMSVFRVADRETIELLDELSEISFINSTKEMRNRKDV